MKNNLISDIKTAVGVFRDIRQGRKNDNVPTARKSVDTTYINTGSCFYNTVEGCMLVGCTGNMDDIAREAFDKLTCEERLRLSLVPKDGEFMERARLWKGLLKPLMTPVQYGTAITAILHLYIRIKQRRIQEQGREDRA